MAINFTVSVFQALVSDVLFQALVADNIRRYGEFPVPAIVRGDSWWRAGAQGWVLGSGWGGVHASMSPPPPGLGSRREFRGWCEGQNVVFSVAWRAR